MLNNTLVETIKLSDTDNLITIKKLVEMEIIKRNMIDRDIRIFNDQVSLFDYGIDELRD